MTRHACALRTTTILLVTLVLGFQTLTAQGRRGGPRSQLLRDVANLESLGDLDGAEQAARRLLESDPTSLGGLSALERILRAKGELIELLPLVDAFLEREADSSEVLYLKLTLLMEVDSLDALVGEAERWMAGDRESDVPYRDVARIYERAFGPQRALDVLWRGRTATGHDEAQALQIGHLLATIGDIDAAVQEWAVAVRDDASEVVAVARSVRSLPADRGSEVARRLVRVLREADLLPRRRAGLSLALDLGLEPEAFELARLFADDLDGPARTSFLLDVATQARAADVVAVASWAYRELGGDAPSPAERRQADRRIADEALVAGDTVTALGAQRRVVESFSPGSADRRRAAAQVIRLEVTSSVPDLLRESWRGFRNDFPNAPELDDLAAAVASALQARGDPDGAAAALEGIEGPKSILEGAYLLLDAGDIEGGRSALFLAAAGLPPSEATAVIQFAGLLGRVSDEGARGLAAAAADAHRGRGVDAALALATETAALPAEDRPPLLAEAARMADRSAASAIAAEIRRRILTEHPDAPEVGEASLALARYHARSVSGLGEAIRLLEELITLRPNAALVPDARVELERLRGRGS